MYQCTEERFLGDIKDHTMNIISDDGTNRHISFTHDGSSVYRFDLITWPGFLCIAGDCGTYVFRRLTDMFDFFRTDRIHGKPDGRTLFINPGYWGEKMESIDKTGRYKEFDKEDFTARVVQLFEEFWEDREDTKHKQQCWNEIKVDVLAEAEEGEHRAYNAVWDFSHYDSGFFFEDFFDGGSTEQYTFHYIWCLYAIAYGVAEYDKLELAKAT